MRWTLPGIVIIPAVYAFIYLDAVWDPASRTAALPVALVNLDEGAHRGDQPLNLGRELVERLERRANFGYRPLGNEQEARQWVRDGRAVFALVIPTDFSSAAMAPTRAGAGRLVVYASEGNNYAGAGFARRFASELGHQVNETLNERRWALVLGSTATSTDKLQALRQGLNTLQDGASALDGGLDRLQSGSVALRDGARTLNEGLNASADGIRSASSAWRTLESQRQGWAEPTAQARDAHVMRESAQALREGAVRLQDGHRELGAGLERLEEGARQLAAGVTALRADVAPIPLLGDRALAATDPLLEGATRLQGGSRLLKESSLQLGSASLQFSAGALQWIDAAQTQWAAASAAQAGLNATLAQIRLPPDERLDELISGGRALAEGSAGIRQATDPLRQGVQDMRLGLATILSSLPTHVDGPDGTAAGLAATVEPVLEIDAPVSSNGMGFLPNFVPVALWMGAVMTAFIFHLRRVPVALAAESPLALLTGKMMMLGGINLAQAFSVLLMSQWLLGLRPVHAVGLALSMAVSGVIFMMLILLLVRLAGDLGKGAALLLLILQLSAAGGVMPIELASDFYGAISPWLPFTWSVRAVRASAFGAFGSEWGAAVGVLLCFGLVFSAMLLAVGRWRFVEPPDHRPAIDV